MEKLKTREANGKITLHEMCKELVTLEEKLDLAESDLEQIGIIQQLQDVDLAMEEKVGGIVRWMRNCDSAAEAIDIEIKRLSVLKKTQANRAEWLKGFLKFTLSKLGMKRFDAGIAKLTMLEPKDQIEVDEMQCYEWPEEVFNACCTEKISCNRSILKQQFGHLLETLPGVKVVKGEPGLMIR